MIRILLGCFLCFGSCGTHAPNVAMDRLRKALTGQQQSWKERHGSIPDALEAPRRLEEAVSLQIFYKINCPHCAEFMRLAVSELVDARLPSEKLQLTILPMIQPPSSREGCLQDPLCAKALPPLCAIKTLMPLPISGDHSLLQSVVKFLACDLAHTASPLGNQEDAVQVCAAEAGMQAAELRRCAEGREIFDTMFSQDYGGHILGAIHILEQEGFPDEIPMPWTFMDGALLQCGGGGCTGIMRPDGVSRLPTPGSLLFQVCSKLSPRPAACDGVQGHMGPLLANVAACENCDEVGISTVARPANRAWRTSWFVPVSGGALAIVLVATVVSQLVWRWRHCQDCTSSGGHELLQPALCAQSE